MVDCANKQLDENNHRIDLLTEQIRIMNQRQLGKRSESSLQSDDGQLSLMSSTKSKEPLLLMPKNPRFTRLSFLNISAKKL